MAIQHFAKKEIPTAFLFLEKYHIGHISIFANILGRKPPHTWFVLDGASIAQMYIAQLAGKIP